MPGISPDRPVIAGYRTIPDYLQAMLRWRKKTDPSFRVHRETRKLYRCSSSLVTRVLQGTRRLTLDRVDAFGRIFRLTPEEKSYLGDWVRGEFSPAPAPANNKGRVERGRRRRKENHLLSKWLHIYIWEASRLKGFKPDAKALHGLLRGIASVKQIERSLQFLFREGYLRRTLDGRVVQNDPVVMTTDDEHNLKIQAFHRQALELARRHISLYPIEKRRESALILVVNESTLHELKELLKDYYEKLMAFAESHLEDNEALYQLTLNLCPIGGDIHGPHTS